MDSAEILVERSELRDRIEALKRREGGAWLVVPMAGLASALVAGGASLGEAVFVGLVTASILAVVVAVFGRSQRSERRALQRQLDELESAVPPTSAGGGRLHPGREGAGRGVRASDDDAQERLGQ